MDANYRLHPHSLRVPHCVHIFTKLKVTCLSKQYLLHEPLGSTIVSSEDRLCVLTALLHFFAILRKCTMVFCLLEAGFCWQSVPLGSK